MDEVFPCAITAYLVSTGRFSIYVAPVVSPHAGCNFLYFITTLFQKAVDVVFFVATTHLISSGFFFSYVVTVVSLSSESNFPHVFATLFEKAMHLVFLPLTLHI